MPLGAVEVVVCDGFAGNVLLKSIEGTAMFMGSLMKHKIFKRNIFSGIGYLFCKSGVDEVMKMLDYREIGGTEFLGIRKQDSFKTQLPHNLGGYVVNFVEHISDCGVSSETHIFTCFYVHSFTF